MSEKIFTSDQFALLNINELEIHKFTLTADGKVAVRVVGGSSGGGGGDMYKAIYDTNNNGIVDNSEALNGQAGSYYLNRAYHTGNQLAATISDLATAISTHADVSANTAARHTHSNLAFLDLIDQDLSADSTPTFNSIQLNGGTGTQGLVTWNTDELTLDLIQNGTTLQLGQETQYNVRNNTVSQIDNGRLVMATGTLGASGRITAGLMDGTNIANTKLILGIATEDIAASTDGKATNFGKVRGIDTTGTLSYNSLETWNDGDLLYVDTAHAGGYMTNVKPTTGMVVPVAIVILAHSNGTLFTRITPINEDYYTTSEVDTLLSGYSLTSHDHSGVYEPAFTKNTAFNKNFGTAAGTVLEGDTDVGIVGTKSVDETSIANGRILSYNSTSGNLEYIALGGGGDMLASIYDPAAGARQVAFADQLFSGAYGDLTGTPTLGTMAAENTTSYYTITQVDTLLAGKANTSHTHSTADITDLASYTGLDIRYYTETEVDTLLSGYSLTSHNHDGVYEPVFTKNTAFNKNFGTAAGTVLEGDTDVGIVGTKSVDETDIADTKILAYNSTSGNLVYIAQPSGGGAGGIETVYIPGLQVQNTRIFKYTANGAKTVGDVSISLEELPVGANFIVTGYKNGTSQNTITITTAQSAEAGSGDYYTKTTFNTALADKDVFELKITQVGSILEGAELNSVIGIT